MTGRFLAASVSGNAGRLTFPLWDYFIIRFLSFYEINATKVEKIVYYTRFKSVTGHLFANVSLVSLVPTYPK
jgi:hypothetical protein